MTVETKSIKVQTNGNGDTLDITSDVQNQITNCDLVSGIVTIFTPSSTSGITTLEFEPGCVEDLQRLFNEILPSDREYAHNKRWGDGNGHS
ncbi:MAG: YjbQ family protein, partial [Anaerolineales bacterium]|nr:YjbQ family protein [Anaerolineales bacterium]